MKNNYISPDFEMLNLVMKKTVCAEGEDTQNGKIEDPTTSTVDF